MVEYCKVIIILWCYCYYPVLVVSPSAAGHNWCLYSPVFSHNTWPGIISPLKMSAPGNTVSPPELSTCITNNNKINNGQENLWIRIKKIWNALNNINNEWTFILGMWKNYFDGLCELGPVLLLFGCVERLAEQIRHFGF